MPLHPLFQKNFDRRSCESRVILLLHKAQPRWFSAGSVDEDSVNVRYPLETEAHKFAALGWGSKPPSAAKLARRLVELAECDWESDADERLRMGVRRGKGEDLGEDLCLSEDDDVSDAASD